MKLNQLDKDGFFEVDHIEGKLPDNWTSDLVGNGYYNAQYQGATRNNETGEWSGGKWAETGGPSVEDIESIKHMQVAIASAEKVRLMSHASDMIEALSDEIEGLDENGDDVPDKLRTDLKAWKQYRVKVKNIDISLAPNIEWPVSPEADLTEA
ncbi:phage tail protein [Yersinia hibernica]|uniref:Phage tail protein n=1 Tax=Yersinia hibernica TaxID=2339259 RepID=A0ABX5QWN0_9GAMM|nr:tail fiber assembly protein [Yersinia hibernica]QAX77698.1 phage tail protein [Yersinia hibernica]